MSSIRVNDFDQNTYSDILWRNTLSGDVGYWIGPIGAVEPYTSIRALPGVWQYADTGEYTAADVSILFQNTVTNQVGFWTINNATGQEFSSFLSVSPSQI